MNLVLPNQRDIADIGLAIKSFSGAWGSIDVFGEYQPSIDEKQLWLMINIIRSDMSSLWEYLGINTEPGSSYLAMLDSTKHTINIRAYKVKTSLFSTTWVGNVFFLFGTSELL